ncbi:MAG TPA: RDD family protein [Terracidiphilus sp.]|nr:RDD family protein [Terracidiphilus sp.]
MDVGRDLSSDQLSIDTPELVAIEMPLAGIGSRFIALLVDYLIWSAGVFLLFLVVIFLLPAMHTFNRISAQWAEAIVIFIFFLLNWGYFTLFEAFWNGRTPGKRVAKIRVIQRSGRSIGLLESMARNLVRYVDQLPFFYGVGVIAMFVTRQHQRLGDLAAGTLVVRDREPESPLWGDTGSRTFTAQLFAPTASIPEPHTAVTLPALGISKLSSTDLEVLEGFFSRRLDMSLATRQVLAQRIAAAIQAKSGLEVPEGTSVETFLEATARQLRDQARLQ